MRASGLRPVRASRLTWFAPPGLDADAFAERRDRLERILSEPRSVEVYAAKRRSIHRVDDAALGPLAVKEVRNASPLRRLRYRYLQEHRALREFRVGAAFAARGGRTPALLAAASEGDALGLRRAFVFVRWLEGALTLTEALRRGGRDPEPALLDAVAASLVDAARLGLVHGRHSSENLLVATGPGAPQIHVIDFAYSRLADGLEATGLVADVARIAHRLVHDGACSRASASALFERVAALAWTDRDAAAQRRAEMEARLDAALGRA